MGFTGPPKPPPLACWPFLPPRWQPRLFQHAPNARRTDGHNVSVKHHERRPPITLQRILPVETDDRFLLPRLKPEITGNPTVVLVDAPVSLPPVIELAGGHAQPVDKPSDADLSPFRPAPDEIHDLVPHVVRHPVPGQSSPRLFFSAMCSAINSAKTSSLVRTLFSKNSIRFCFSSTWRCGRSCD